MPGWSFRGTSTLPTRGYEARVACPATYDLTLHVTPHPLQETEQQDAMQLMEAEHARLTQRVADAVKASDKVEAVAAAQAERADDAERALADKASALTASTAELDGFKRQHTATVHQQHAGACATQHTQPLPWPLTAHRCRPSRLRPRA